MNSPAMNRLYQVVFLGRKDERADRIVGALGERLDDLGIPQGAVTVLSESEVEELDPKLPVIAIFLGYPGARDAEHKAVSVFLSGSNIVITVVSSLENVPTEIPESLRHINAIDIAASRRNIDRIVSLLLEGFRLLRRERRLFISYRRADSRSVANQLYDALDSRGFDVFIDVRSVPPGMDFQNELWHRISDSDVVVLIDTPGFRKSRWTTEELARANATNIQILHLLWPGQPEDPESAFSHFFSLTKADFVQDGSSRTEQLTEGITKEICDLAERLRARALAARHRYLVDSFCDAAKAGGIEANVQPQRWISVKLSGGRELAVVPTVGIPTSDRINYVLDAISESSSLPPIVWVLYDNRGMLATWLKHLEWLDIYLPAKSVKVAAAEQALREISA